MLYKLGCMLSKGGSLCKLTSDSVSMDKYKICCCVPYLTGSLKIDGDVRNWLEHTQSSRKLKIAGVSSLSKSQVIISLLLLQMYLWVSKQ